MNLRRRIIGLIAGKPTSFSYSVEDFNKAKFWAMGQPHPTLKNKTLWDHFNYKWADSVEILNGIKIYIESNGTIK